jgi:peptidoglycan hydrolase-like protein with peptidoglycan-binding domain
MSYSLTWLAKVLRDAGLIVAEQPNWQTRGLGDVGPTKGVLCHHTAGPAKGNMPSLGTITNGRPDLQGPLAQLGLGRDGTWYVVAAGRCNHAGKGSWQGVTSGNTNFIGIEAENTGLPPDSPWPNAQMDSYRRGVAAILTEIKAKPIMCAGHKEYALPKGRKDDPDFDMVAFRAAVAAIMDGTTPKPPPIPAQSGARKTIRRGDENADVGALQTLLAIAPSGMFDGATEAKVRDYQRAQGLTPDGIVGPKTWGKLEPAPPPPAGG